MLYKRISEALLKKGFEMLAKKYGLSVFSGFSGGLIIMLINPFFSRMIREKIIVPADDSMLSYANKKDKTNYYKLLKYGENIITEKEKLDYQKTFLKKISDVISIKKYLKK